MNAALYWTVWIALSLFAFGEIGRRRARASAWPASAVGFSLLVIHICISMATRHQWSHASSVAATAAQTRVVYGLDWGGGVYVNYLFVAVWLADLLVWRMASKASTSRPTTARWIVRGFYLVVIANAAIVFAGGWRALAGVIVMAALVWAWRR